MAPWMNLVNCILIKNMETNDDSLKDKFQKDLDSLNLNLVKLVEQNKSNNIQLNFEFIMKI